METVTYSINPLNKDFTNNNNPLLPFSCGGCFNLSDMKFEITKVQLSAIMDITDTLSALTGGGDMEFNDTVARDVKAIDRMLKKNGYKRNYS